MLKMAILRAAAAVLAVAPVAAGAAAGPAYDLVIRGGKVIDGTGNGWFYADVAVSGERIAAVGDLSKAEARETIDAKGLVVAPGFIDVHTHADTDLYGLPLAENFIRDGVTTIITGNCGGSPKDVGLYYGELKKRGVTVNVGTLIGHNTVLRAVKGDKAGDLTGEQMEQAKGIVREAMEDGAVGFSTGLIYRPGTYSKTEEIIEMARVSAGYGGIYVTHMRNEGMGVLDAIDEALRIGREAGCRVEISHFKLTGDGSKKVGGSDATIARVMAARAAGQEVWMDQYPYTASSTSISTLLPDDFLEQGEAAARKKLDDPQVEYALVEQMRRTFEVERGRKHMGYVVIAGSRQFPQYEGKNLLQIAQIEKLTEGGKRPELLGDGNAMPEVSMADQCRVAVRIWKAGGASCVFHSMNEPDVVNIMRNPLVSVASDSGVRRFGSGSPHPRGYGTNARVLGEYVRNQRVITLEDAVRKMTSQPALAFRLKERGTIRAGNYADITVFDPNTVVDKATFEKPHAYSEGFAHVLVNGQVVFTKGEMTQRLPGQPLVGPGYKSAEATPASAQQAGG